MIAPEARCRENIDGGASATPSPCRAASIMPRDVSKTMPAFTCAAGVTPAGMDRAALEETLQSGEDGRVELELPPGRYSVRIEAPGYRSHTQSVQIKGNGVSVLNADLRAE